MQPLLIAGSAATLALTLCFFSVGTSIIVRAKQPRAIWAAFWFAMSLLWLAAYAFLWQMALGQASLSAASANVASENTVDTVRISPLWISAIGTFSLAFMTFYISVIEPRLKRPNLAVSFENKEPYCTMADVPPQSYWLRVKVTNRGRAAAKACVGRLVQYADVNNNSIDREPLRLHWVGTPWLPSELLYPIDLNRGDSAFLDVLITQNSSPEIFLYTNAFVEAVIQARTPEIPQPDWRSTGKLPRSVARIRIAIYGENVEPSSQEYFVSWHDRPDYKNIKLEKV